MHGEGLGAIVIAVCLLVGIMTLIVSVKRWLALSLSLGAAIYPWCWLYLRASTQDKGKLTAKADIHWIAVGSVTIYFSVLLCLFTLLLLYQFTGTSSLARYFFDDHTSAT